MELEQIGKCIKVVESCPETTLSLETAIEKDADSVSNFHFTPSLIKYFEEIFEISSSGRGQGFWIQAEYGAGKTHMIATLAALLTDNKGNLWKLVTDKEITSKDIRNKPGKPGEGVGIVEAARGTLIHHYILDEKALAKKVNLIVATTHNAPGICMSIKNAASGLIKNGKVNDGLLNMVEMAFRAYDPCFGCATHSLPGQMPMVVRIRAADGTVLSETTRD